jgi:hypothetical protein
MEGTMIHRSLSYDPTPEHRQTRAKWTRGFCIVYGTILLLLLGIVAVQPSRREHNGAPTIANRSAARQVPADLGPAVAISAPTASQAANTRSRTN